MGQLRDKHFNRVVDLAVHEEDSVAVTTLARAKVPYSILVLIYDIDINDDDDDDDDDGGDDDDDNEDDDGDDEKD